MHISTTPRGLVAALGLLLILLGALGEVAALGRWVSVGSQLDAADQEYAAAVGRVQHDVATTSYENARSGLREVRGKYYLMIQVDGRETEYREITSLTKLKADIEQRKLKLANDRTNYPPLMLGLTIPIVLGVALYLFGKDE